MVAAMTMTSVTVPNMVLFGTTVLAADYTELQTATAGSSDSLGLSAAMAAAGLSVYSNGAEASTYTLPSSTKLYSTNGTVRFSSTSGAYYHSTGYGAAIKPGDTIEVNVAGSAEVKLQLSQYAPADGVFTITSSADNSYSATMNARPDSGTDKDYNTLSYSGGATTLTFTYSGGGQGYLVSVGVTNDAQPDETLTAVDFDFMLDSIATDGVVNAGVVSGVNMGDSVLELIGNGTTNYDTSKKWKVNIDGTEYNAYWAGSRPAAAGKYTALPKAGDGTCALFTPAANGMFKAYVYSTAAFEIYDYSNGTLTKYATFNAVPTAAVTVKAGHTYLISTTSATNNFGFAGFKYVADASKELTVEQWQTTGDYDFDTAEFDIVDADLGTKKATVGKSTASVTLAKGHTYTVEPQDSAIGVTVNGEESDTFTVSDSLSSIKLHLEKLPEVTLTGNFITNNGGAPDVTAISFKNMKTGNVANGTIASDGKSYSVQINPGEYNTTVTSAGYETYDRVHIGTDGTAVSNDVYLESLAKSEYDLYEEVSRGTSALTMTGTVKLDGGKTTHVAAGNGATITVPVSGVQKVTVAGYYSGEWNIDGKNSVTASSTSASNPDTTSITTDGTVNSVTVNVTGTGTTYLCWIKVEDVAAEFDAENTTIKVPSEQFPTLKSANAYINNLANRPSGEDGRMTIELTDDIEEQIVFDAPYITVDGKGHKISWYYGVGSYYYSVDSKGYYSDRLFYDKYSSNEANGSLWGGVAIVRGDNFIAKDTTFINTYNYYVTEKDAADFEHATGKLAQERKVGTDVAVYNAKERSNAFYIEAKNIQLYNCKVLSSQDTFGRNGSAKNGYSVYVKDSVIGGNVDYICGEFNAVFDNCKLEWKTYSQDAAGDKSNNAKIGYIVAPKTSPYIFRNCEVTVDDPSVETVVGQYGRTWGAGSLAFFNATQTNGHIKTDAWGEMTSGDAASAKFYEFANLNGEEAFESVATSSSKATATKVDADILNKYASDSIFKSDGALGFEPAEYYSRSRDVNADGKADNADAKAILAYSAGTDTVIVSANAEIDGKDPINLLDAIEFLKETDSSDIKE